MCFCYWYRFWPALIKVKQKITGGIQNDIGKISRKQKQGSRSMGE